MGCEPKKVDNHLVLEYWAQLIFIVNLKIYYNFTYNRFFGGNDLSLLSDVKLKYKTVASTQ